MAVVFSPLLWGGFDLLLLFIVPIFTLICMRMMCEYTLAKLKDLQCYTDYKSLRALPNVWGILIRMYGVRGHNSVRACIGWSSG